MAGERGDLILSGADAGDIGDRRLGAHFYCRRGLWLSSVAIVLSNASMTTWGYKLISLVQGLLYEANKSCAVQSWSRLARTA